MAPPTHRRGTGIFDGTSVAVFKPETSPNTKPKAVLWHKWTLTVRIHDRKCRKQHSSSPIFVDGLLSKRCVCCRKDLITATFGIGAFVRERERGRLISLFRTSPSARYVEWWPGRGVIAQPGPAAHQLQQFGTFLSLTGTPYSSLTMPMNPACSSYSDHDQASP